MRILIILVSIYMFSGCCSYKKVERKYAQLSTKSVTVSIDTTLFRTVITPVPEVSFQSRLSLDLLLSRKSTDTIFLQDPTSQARAKFWKDKYNNYLFTHIDCVPDTIIQEIIVPYDTQIDCPPTVLFEKPTTWFSRAWNGFKNISTIILLGIIIFRFIKLY